MKCLGCKLYTIPNVKEHFIHNGRDPSFKVWRGPRNKDSLDEAWEEHFRVPTRH
jgi:hypothetical protein